MKATLLFATLSMVFALPSVSAKTELEALRERCIEQEQKIRSLEEQVHQLRGSKAEPSKAVAKAPVSSESTGSYVVKAGDSVERIARRHQCSVASINKLNGLKSTSLIHPGQRLKVPGMASAKAETPAASSSKPVATASLEGKTHKIKQGETYGSIAKEYRVSVDSLIAANPSVKPTALRPGLEIRLSAATSSPSAPVSKSAPAMASRPATPPSAPKPVSQSTPKPEPAIQSPSGNPKPSPRLEQNIASTMPVSTSGVLPTSSPSAPLKSAATEVTKNPAPAPEKKIRSVKIEGPMTYGQFAAQHGTDPNRLNDLNGLDLTQATVLAKGSELYVPAQP